MSHDGVARDWLRPLREHLLAGWAHFSGTLQNLCKIEYAVKAVENAGTALAVRTKHGVVFGVENLVHSKLMVSGSHKRIFGVDRHAALTSAGLIADGKHLANRARDEANNFFDTYKQKAPIKTIAERLALYVQAFTLYSSVRPFGASAIVGGVDAERGPQLYVIEPSGMVLGYHGCAVGKGKQFAKTEIEKLALDELSMEQAVYEVARMYVELANSTASTKPMTMPRTRNSSWNSRGSVQMGGICQCQPTCARRPFARRSSRWTRKWKTSVCFQATTLSTSCTMTNRSSHSAATRASTCCRSMIGTVSVTKCHCALRCGVIEVATHMG